MNKLCFDCLNSTSGMCNKHTKDLEKKYVSCSATNTTMSKNDIIDSLVIQKEQLIKEVKQREKELMSLYVLIPVFLMMMMLIIKSGLVFFLLLPILFFQYRFWNILKKLFKNNN